MLVDLTRAEEAIDYLLQAQDAFDEIDYPDGVGYALHILGRCYLSLGTGRRMHWSACGGRWPATRPRATGAGRRRR